MTIFSRACSFACLDTHFLLTWSGVIMLTSLLCLVLINLFPCITEDNFLVINHLGTWESTTLNLWIAFMGELYICVCIKEDDISLNSIYCKISTYETVLQNLNVKKSFSYVLLHKSI